jgi:TP901 family phage tail tape measure protein
MPVSVGEIWSALRVDGSQARKDAERAGGEAGTAAGKSMGQKVGESLRKNTTKALVGAGAALGGFAAASVQEFGRFQNSMNEVFTLLPGISGDAMKEMSGQVKQFSKDFGVLPEDVVPALYNALSAGVPKDNVFEFLEVANKAAKGGVVDLNTAVNGLSTVVNAFGADVISAGRASDVMFTTVRLGKTTMGELASSMSNVAPIASSLGIDFGDIGAALAAMTAQGTPTSVATTQLRAAFVELSKAGTPVDALFRRLAGQSFREFIASGGDVQGALQLLEKHAIDSNLSISDLFGSVEAGSAVLQLTGKGTETFTNNLGQMQEAAGATDAAFETMESGIQTAANRVTAWVRTMALDIGEEMQALGPLFIAFGPTVGRWLGVGLGAIGGLLAKGLGAAFLKLGGQRVLTAAIGAAGAAAGAVYAAAAAAAEKLLGALSGAWAAAGKPGSSVIRAAAAAGRAMGLAAAAAAAAALIAIPLIVEGDTPILPVDMETRIARIQGMLDELRQHPPDDLIPNSTRRFGEAIRLYEAELAALKDGNLELADSIRLGKVGLDELSDTVSTLDLSGVGASLAESAARMTGSFRSAGADSVQAMAEGVRDRTDDIKGAWFIVARESAAVMQAGMREMVRNMRIAPLNMRDAIRSGKERFLEEVRWLAWQVKKSMKRMREAKEAGRPGLVAQEKALQDELRAEMMKMPEYAAEATRKAVAAMNPLLYTLASVRAKIFDAVGGLFGAEPRSTGGPVTAGSPYIVGDGGRPELFVPRQSGYVFPSVGAGMAAMGGGHSTLEVTIRDPDGGLARAGMGIGELADAITGALQTTHIGYNRPRGAF